MAVAMVRATWRYAGVRGSRKSARQATENQARRGQSRAERVRARDPARRTWIISTGLFDGHVAGGAAHGCGTICGCMWVDAAPICGSLCGGATMTRMGAG